MSWLREADEEPIPGYRLIKPLGSGGFGEVWQCEAPGKILKAIKFVFGNLDASASGDGRARQEFHALQRVKEVRHPFVLSIERIDILDGEVAIVMELAEKSLHDVLQEVRDAGLPGIPRDKLWRHMSDSAEGLDYLSEAHNLMHLDVKPRNLFIVGDRVKVADFGLAKHLERQSASGILAGISPQYSAPETFTSRITKSSDQYSLAIVYVELLTGQRPFSGKTIRELALQHMSAPPNLTGLPDVDRRAVARALDKEPLKRFPSCKAFVEALGNFSVALPINLTTAGGVPDGEPPPTAAFADFHLADSLSTSPTRFGVGVLPPAPPPAAPLPAPAPTVKPRVDDSQLVRFDHATIDGAVLRPTLLIGLGGFGLLALRELRSRLTDRVGDLGQVPSIRFLYIDADPEAKSVGIAGSPDRALGPEAVFPTPLQPVTRYRRAALDHLSEWLPQEKLHAIPRGLHPQGSRALGRLAFTENYLRFVTRVRRELEIAAHPESVSRSADHAGLPARDTRPRIFVVAGAGGASSGALPDVGFALRQLLGQLKLPTDVSAFLYLGAPADPTTPAAESANVYSTLTELNHYADAGIRFQARYGGPDGPEVESTGRPYSAIYLVQRGGRGPSAAAECAERVAAYLSLDLTTPLGADLDRDRGAAVISPFRSFGTGGVWFPRGLLLRSAARHVVEQLIQQWQASASAIPPAVAELCHRVLSDPALKTEQIVAQIAAAVGSSDAVPGDIVGGLLGNLENGIAANEGAAAVWARQAFDDTMALVGVKGSHDPADAARTGKLTKLYTTAITAIGDAWIRKLGGEALGLLESPGRRVAAAEAALARMSEFCERAEDDSFRHAADATRRSEQAFAVARAATEVCAHGGGFSLFGGKAAKNMRALLAALTQYAARRTEEEAQAGAVRFFRKVKAGLEDRQRDLSICRQRLTHLKRGLELPATAGASICGGPSPTVELLLPDGGEEVEWAAKRFVETVKPASIAELDKLLQALVLDPRGGLYAACQKAGDFIHELADPLIDQTAAFLGTLLPINDVADFAADRGQNWPKRLRRAHDRAAPTVVGVPENEREFLLVPDTTGGQRVALTAANELPGAQVYLASQANEVTTCRELRLRPADLQEAMRYAREAYDARVRKTALSPHARYDVVEWLPLDV